MSETETRTSIGGVLFKRTPFGIKFLLVQSSEKKYWEFPKGKQEESESEIDTLKRELNEETGISKITVIDNFKFSYLVNVPGQKRMIVYYLVEFLDTKITISSEHIAYKLVDYDDAKKLLIIPKLLELLDVVHKKIS